MPVDVHERRVRLLVSAAAVIPALLATVQAYISAKVNGTAAEWRDLAFSGGDWLALAPLIPLAYAAGRRLPITRSQSMRRASLHIAAALSFAVAWASAGMLLGLALHHFPAEQPYARAYLNWILITLPFGTLMYLAVLGSSYAYAYFVEARERDAQLATARLGALRMQLHPHFLFNTLNTVLVLVREKNNAEAARALELLADLLRQVTRTNRPHEIPLGEELSFLERYLGIEQMRFSDRLRVRWSIEPAARNALVPEFVLQPIVENAIRHGFAKRAEAGAIAIEGRLVEDSLELAVTDDGAGLDPSASESRGLGLSTTRERLRTLYGDRGGMTIESAPGAGTRVVLRMPLRRMRDGE
jgi:signal transduction histidine kinase